MGTAVGSSEGKVARGVFHSVSGFGFRIRSCRTGAVELVFAAGDVGAVAAGVAFCVVKP